MPSKITLEDYVAVADLLHCDIAAIKAVQEVESAGSGFLADGRLKILFEGHIFWRQLHAASFDPSQLLKDHPGYENVLYQKWDRSQYKGLEKEWGRMSGALSLCKAIGASTDLALNSASYGAFQIMGFNAGACGFQTAQEFFAFVNKGEYEQLMAFAHYLNKTNLCVALRRHDWPAFAEGYNGPDYKGNPYTTNDDYDLKLAKAFNRYKPAA